MGARRDEWAARVRRWRRSGLRAKEFAESIGVKSSTLSYWGWRLAREETAEARRDVRALSVAGLQPGVIEVVTDRGDERFELDLGGGRRLLIPASFEPGALERLLAVLEAASR